MIDQLSKVVDILINRALMTDKLQMQVKSNLEAQVVENKNLRRGQIAINDDFN